VSISGLTNDNAPYRTAGIRAKYKSGADVFTNSAAVAFRGIDNRPALPVKNYRLIRTLLHTDDAAAGIPGYTAIRNFRQADAHGLFVKRTQRFRWAYFSAFTAEIAVSESEIHNGRTSRRETISDAYH